MGKNKGKGSANLRRLNAIKKTNDFEKLHTKLIREGLPEVSFSSTPVYIHIDKKSEEQKVINYE